LVNHEATREVGVHLGGVLARARAHPRRLTYEDAEADAKTLAAALVAAFGQHEIKGFSYTAIPRGGFFVLGMLSYVLDLPGKALKPRSSGEPLVVVDDCSLSGARIRNFLDADDTPQMVFAHLYSHPELRSAIRTQEPRVLACLSAGDLYDLAPETYPDEDAYRAWQARWRERFQGQRYWIGLPELVIFPWSEPDFPIWNPVMNRVEDTWRLAPPDRCLKNWGRLGLSPRADSKRTLRSPDDVAYSLEDDNLTLCRLKTEQVYGLHGAATEMWRALAAYGDPAIVVQHLYSRYDVDEATLSHDVDNFIRSMLESGLLELCNESYRA
jgi:hypothetical protein